MQGWGHRDLSVTEKSFLVVQNTVKLVDFKHGKKQYFSNIKEFMTGFSKGDLVDLALLAIFLQTGKSLFDQNSKSYHDHYSQIFNTVLTDSTLLSKLDVKPSVLRFVQFCVGKDINSWSEVIN